MKTTFLFRFFLFISVTALLISCSNSNESNLSNKQVTDSIQHPKINTIDLSQISKEPGVVGVFKVGEMLTICKLDSAPMRDVSFKVAKAYSVLEEEMNTIGAKLEGSPGMITYNNDTSNFIFECVLPIKEFPKKQPKHCKVVVLEASQMLIFNFYGPYQHLFSAYDKIRKYNTANHLQQNGPMREFYLTDATLESDPAKWQTQIMVPVVKVK